MEIIKREGRSQRRHGGETKSGQAVVLLLLGEFQRVAEDLERRLFRTESTCLGRLTAEIEHRPVKPRAYRTHTLTHTSQDGGALKVILYSAYINRNGNSGGRKK